MRLTWQSFRFLTQVQKLELFSYLSLKVGIAAFDIIGLVLLSTSMSLLASTPVGDSPVVAAILGWCAALGFGNTYAVFALVATIFFLIKSLAAIWLNNRIAIFGATVEAQQATKLFGSLSATDFEGDATETQTSYQFAIGRSAHVLFAQVPVVLGTIIGEVSLALAIAVYLATVNPVLLALALVFLGLVGYLNFSLVSRGVVRNNQSSIEAGLETQQLVLDLIANSRQIRAQKKTSSFVNRFEGFRRAQALATSKVVALGYMSRYITEIAVIVGVALFLAQRTFFGTSDVSAATLTVFLAAAFRVIASMIPIQTAFATLSIINHEGNLAFTLLSSEPQVDSSRAHPSALQPHIELRDVSYKYPNGTDFIIQGMNLDIAFGSFVVVKGPSGAGKSTLVDLMVGLKSPSTGTIRVSETNSEVELGWADIGLGYVPQKPNLIEGTLLQNVSLDYAEQADSKSRAVRALEKAQLSEWLSELAMGLDEKFGISATNLSGGQLQRLGIARALFGEPVVLVLDEGTNSLDPETELEIRRILEGLKSHITIIVISHNDVFDSLATLKVHLEKVTRVTIEGKP
jgi:ABC-type bacteriocin/lantibiotic exporter with double-glycine peptidase domain